MQPDPENDADDAGEDSQLGTVATVPCEPTHLNVKEDSVIDASPTENVFSQ